MGIGSTVNVKSSARDKKNAAFQRRCLKHFSGKLADHGWQQIINLLGGYFPSVSAVDFLNKVSTILQIPDMSL
jgi:hypothetical protein